MQLGARYLDLRLCWNAEEKTWFAFHGLLAARADDVLRNVSRFLNDDALRGEFLFLQLSHLYGSDAAQQVQLIELVDALLDSTRMLPKSHALATTTLGAALDAGYRMVVWMDNDEVVDKYDYLWSTYYTLSGEYANAQETAVMEEHNTMQLKTLGGGTADDAPFFIQFFTLTPTAAMIVDGIVHPDAPRDETVVHSLLELSERCNGDLGRWLASETNGTSVARLALPNTVMVDFLEESNVLEMVTNYLVSNCTDDFALSAADKCRRWALEEHRCGDKAVAAACRRSCGACPSYVGPTPCTSANATAACLSGTCGPRNQCLFFDARAAGEPCGADSQCLSGTCTAYRCSATAIQAK